MRSCFPYNFIFCPWIKLFWIVYYCIQFWFYVGESKGKLLKLCIKQKIYFFVTFGRLLYCLVCVIIKVSIFVLPFGRILYCQKCVIIKGSVLVVPFGSLISWLLDWCFWLNRLGSIFVVPFGKLLSCLPSWCFWLNTFGVASNFVIYLGIIFPLFAISKLMQVILYSTLSDVIPFYCWVIF